MTRAAWDIGHVTAIYVEAAVKLRLWHATPAKHGEWRVRHHVRDQTDWRGLPCLHCAGGKTGNICVMVVTNPDKYPKVTQEFVFLGGPLAVFKSRSYWHLNDLTLDFLFLMQIPDLQTGASYGVLVLYLCWSSDLRNYYVFCIHHCWPPRPRACSARLGSSA